MAADYEAVARAALSMARTLLPAWVGGKAEGHEWLAARRANGGIGDSWKINLLTGRWANFSGDATGADMIQYYAAVHHVDVSAALKAVRQATGLNGRYVPVLAHTRPPEEPAEEIPFDAPPLPDHRTLGPASAVYEYGDSFRVARYEGPPKSFRQFTWREGRWVAKGAKAPLELYNKIFLDSRPEAPVLVVEGEKCVLAGAPLLPDYVVTTWAGGAGADKKSDWSALAGRDVILWPDADAPGREAVARIAARLLPIATRVRMITPDAEAPEGWDIADAIAAGVALEDYLATHAGAPLQAPEANRAVRPRGPEAPTAREAPRSEAPLDDTSPLVNWRSLNLDCNEGGVPFATLANASLIVQAHPALKGRIWLDSFRGRIYHKLHGVETPWTDADTRRVTVLMQQSLKLPKMTTHIVLEALEHAAELNARNSLTVWLDGLVWDEQPRLDTWLTDTLGTEIDEYSLAISRNWPIAMVARAYRPGCKMDNMPVLEGVSGLQKTTFLEVLGAPWYKSFPHVGFGDKDFLQGIQGAWLIEIPDMTNFSRREHSQVLATITTRVDSYRASYGRMTEDHPRTAIFAATSESDEYLADTRGKRRYWPLRCEQIDIEALIQQKEQVFAEAVQCYRQGEVWYKMPGQAAREQEARVVEPDAWTDAVLDYVEHATDTQGRVTTAAILRSAIDVPLAKQTLIEQRRVGRILREAGWIRGRTDDFRYWKKAPDRK